MDFTDCSYAFEELTRAVVSGQMPARVERVFRRLVFGDKMIPSIGNKYAFEEFLNKGKSGVYCVIDINSFKQVNDMYGHEVGDEVIIKLGKAIRGASTDYHKSTNRRSKVFRIGGDEFVVFLESIIGYQEFFSILHRYVFALDLVKNNHRISISVGCGSTYSIADSYLLKAKEIKSEFLNKKNGIPQKLPNIFLGEIYSCVKTKINKIRLIIS